MELSDAEWQQKGLLSYPPLLEKLTKVLPEEATGRETQA